MGQTYSDFKTYLTRFIWRQNDTDLSTDLDVIIQQADDELDHMTRDWQRRQKTVAIAPESEDFDLTTNVSDFQAVQSVTNNTADTYFQSSRKKFEQVTLSTIYELRAKYPNGPLRPVYGVDRDDGTLYLRFVAPFSASDPGDLTLVYRIAIPDYSGTDASWMEDEYLNLYLYTILKHVGMYLREDERVQQYAQLQQQAFSNADMDDKHHLQFGGSPLRMNPHRRVP